MTTAMKKDVSELKSDMSAVKADVSTLKTDVAVLKTDVSELKTDVSVLKTDVSELKTDVSVLKTDVSELKTDVSVLKTDVSGLKTDMSVLKADMTDVKSVNRRIIATLVRLEGKVDDMGERMATKDDLRAQNAKLDAFGGLLEDMRFRYAVHADTLMRHDERIARLEAREPRP